MNIEIILELISNFDYSLKSFILLYGNFFGLLSLLGFRYF